MQQFATEVSFNQLTDILHRHIVMNPTARADLVEMISKPMTPLCMFDVYTHDNKVIVDRTSLFSGNEATRFICCNQTGAVRFEQVASNLTFANVGII